MQSPHGKHLFEYAIVRYVPRVEREEFINVGLVMMCKRRRWIRARFLIDEERLLSFSPGADVESLRRQLESFQKVSEGCMGEIGSLEAHERFRWLTAVRSACISTSRPHPGICADLDATFDRLFADLVSTDGN